MREVASFCNSLQCNLYYTKELIPLNVFIQKKIPLNVASQGSCPPDSIIGDLTVNSNKKTSYISSIW